MNPPSATSTVPFIQAAAGRRHAARAARWACLSVIAILAPLALLAWSDSLLVLSTRWRWAALVVVGLALVGALISFTRACRRPSPKEAARALDQAASLSNSYAVSTSRELTGTSPADPVECELLAHLHATATRLAATAKPVQPWPGVLTLCAALVSLLAFLTIAAKENGLAIRRALQPWMLLPYTGIELRGPSEAPAKREPFAITGTVSGRIPKDLRLTWSGGRSATVPLNPDGSFSFPLALGIQQPSTFAADAAADGHSAPLPIALRRVPKVQSYHFGVTPPSYTGWPASTESRPGFVVLRGSSVGLTLQLDLPAKTVTFIPDNNQANLPLASPGGDGKAWQANLGKMSRTFSYRIEITDEKSTYQAEADPQMIVVRPDAPPKFESLTHNGDKLADAEPPDEFTLKFRATDDIGLARTFISCQSLTKAQLPREMLELPEHPLDHPGSWSVSLKSLREAGIQPLDIIIVTVAAIDTNTLDGPGTVSEPIFLEMPFPPSDKKDGAGAGGSQSGGQGEQPQEVNPLALQKDLHRQLVRASLGLKAPAPKEIAEQQQAVAGHLEKMAKSPDAAQLGQPYVEHLQQALAAALKTAEALANPPPPNMPQFRMMPQSRSAVTLSGETLGHLIEAAKIEAAAQQQASQKPPGGDPPPPGDGKPDVKYSLIKSPAKADKPNDDAAKKDEQIEKAVADLDQLRREQEQLDQDAAKLDAKDKPADSNDSQQSADKPGQPKDGEPKDGQQPGAPKPGQQPGQNPGQPGQGPPPSDLAAKQDALLPKTADILKNLENLKKGDSQTDPKQAAEALSAAKAYQEKVAAALREANLTKAREMGAKSEEALDVATLLTKSLLEKAIRQSIEAQAPAPGYESLIQEYSRRISYDQ